MHICTVLFEHLDIYIYVCVYGAETDLLVNAQIKIIFRDIQPRSNFFSFSLDGISSYQKSLIINFINLIRRKLNYQLHYTTAISVSLNFPYVTLVARHNKSSRFCFRHLPTLHFVTQNFPAPTQLPNSRLRLSPLI